MSEIKAIDDLIKYIVGYIKYLECGFTAPIEAWNTRAPTVTPDPYKYGIMREFIEGIATGLLYDSSYFQKEAKKIMEKLDD